MSILNTDIMSFYHPTKVVFVDDNQSFLDAIALELYEQENTLLFTNPESAMQLCKNIYTEEPEDRPSSSSSILRAIL